MLSKQLLDKVLTLFVILGIQILTNITWAQKGKVSYQFDFGSGDVESGYIQILPAMIYSQELGYGFEPGAQIEAVGRESDDALRGDYCTSNKPFYFSVKLPEGNYKVTITMGDLQGESVTTIKAELRRLMLEEVKTETGHFETRTIIVNTRTSNIPDGNQVRLKDREKTQEKWAWDEKLTLEFNNSRPCVCAIEVEKVDDISTVYILGDSTVCDQSLEPWNSWGQMLTRFFNSDIAIANHAESGESIRSSMGARRFDKVYSLMKPGDYLIVQFGHNDMKSRAPNAVETYKSDLKNIVKKVRELKCTPILVTSMERKSGIERDTLRDYPDKVREVAREDNVKIIDLHAMSKILYTALGDSLDKAFQDGTHHNNYGSYQLAKCVVEGIKQNNSDLSKYIVDDFSGFDPSHPDPVDNFKIPASPGKTNNKPEGN